jgi:SulP family sulfate permease
MFAVILELDSGRDSRVGTIQPGTVVGEIGFYLGKPRTASVVATQPGVVYRLSLSAFRRLEADHPQIAAALHQWIANILAERLSDNVSTLQALLD